MCGAKLGDICLLKAHRGPGENASNYTQYAKCPHSPGGNIRGGKSNEFNKPGDKEWNQKAGSSAETVHWSLLGYCNKGTPERGEQRCVPTT